MKKFSADLRNPISVSYSATGSWLCVSQSKALGVRMGRLLGEQMLKKIRHFQRCGCTHMSSPDVLESFSTVNILMKMLFAGIIITSLRSLVILQGTGKAGRNCTMVGHAYLPTKRWLKKCTVGNKAMATVSGVVCTDAEKP